MATIDSITLEVDDVDTAEAFYHAAFEPGDWLRLRASQEPTSGFRGFTLSLVVSQPGNVDALADTALKAGASTLKPVTKSFWGYCGVIQAPDGTIWKIASSSKKDTGPTTRTVDEVVILMGVNDVKTTRQFYVDHGLAVGKSFGSKYIEFETLGATVKLALYTRGAAAKDAGVDPQGSGSHRIVIAGDAGPFTDPDGFAWKSTAAEKL